MKKISRKAFLTSQGFSVKNPCHWSYLNESTKTIVFSNWEGLGSISPLFAYDWEISKHNNRKNPNFKPALEHVKLIRFHDYKVLLLQIHPTKASLKDWKNQTGPLQIDYFSNMLKETEVEWDNNKQELNIRN